MEAQVSKLSNHAGTSAVFDNVTIIGKGQPVSRTVSHIAGIIQPEQTRKNLEAVKGNIDAITSDSMITDKERGALKREWASMTSSFRIVQQKLEDVQQGDCPAAGVMHVAYTALEEVLKPIFNSTGDYTLDGSYNLTEMFITAWVAIQDAEIASNEAKSFSEKYELRIEGNREVPLGKNPEGPSLALLASFYRDGKFQADLEFTEKTTFTWSRVEKPEGFKPKTGRQIQIYSDDLLGASTRFTVEVVHPSADGLHSDKMSMSFTLTRKPIIEHGWSDKLSLLDADAKTIDWKPEDTPPNPHELKYLWGRISYDYRTSWSYFRETGQGAGFQPGSNIPSSDVLPGTFAIIAKNGTMYPLSSRGFVTGIKTSEGVYEPVTLVFVIDRDRIDAETHPASWTVPNVSNLSAVADGDMLALKLERGFSLAGLLISATIPDYGKKDISLEGARQGAPAPYNFGSVTEVPVDRASNPFTVPDEGLLMLYDHCSHKTIDTDGKEIYTTKYWNGSAWEATTALDDTNANKGMILGNTLQGILQSKNIKKFDAALEFYAGQLVANYAAIQKIHSSDIMLITHQEDDGTVSKGKVRSAGYNLGDIDKPEKKKGFYCDTDGNAEFQNLRARDSRFTNTDVDGRLTSQALDTRDVIHSAMNNYRPRTAEYSFRKIRKAADVYTQVNNNCMHKGKLYCVSKNHSIYEYDTYSQSVREIQEVTFHLPEGFSAAKLLSTDDSLYIFCHKMEWSLNSGITWYAGWLYGPDIDHLKFIEPSLYDPRGGYDLNLDASMKLGSNIIQAYVHQGQLYVLIEFYNLVIQSQSVGKHYMFARVTPYVKSLVDVEPSALKPYCEQDYAMKAGRWTDGHNWAFSYQYIGFSPYVYCGTVTGWDYPVFYSEESSAFKKLDFTDPNRPGQVVTGVYPCKKKSPNGSYGNYLYVVTTTAYSDGKVDTLYQVDAGGSKQSIQVTDSPGQRILNVIWNEIHQTPEVWVYDYNYRYMYIYRIGLSYDNEAFYSEAIGMGDNADYYYDYYTDILPMVYQANNGTEQAGIVFQGGVFAFGYKANGTIHSFDTRYGQPFLYTLRSSGTFSYTSALTKYAGISAITCNDTRIIINFYNGNRFEFRKDVFYPYFSLGVLEIWDKPASNIVSDIIPRVADEVSIGTPVFRIKDIFTLALSTGNLIFDMNLLPKDAANVTMGRTYVDENGFLKVKLTN